MDKSILGSSEPKKWFLDTFCMSVNTLHIYTCPWKALAVKITEPILTKFTANVYFG